MKITLALCTLWNYLHAAPFDRTDNKKDKRKLFFPDLPVKITNISICYYSIKIHKTYDIHIYFFFPEMLL